jgi:hypothetical protein
VGLPSFAGATHKENLAMSFNPKDIERIADAYTAAWNAGSPQGVAGYFAEDGEIVINRGTPWRGRAGVIESRQSRQANIGHKSTLRTNEPETGPSPTNAPANESQRASTYSPGASHTGL